MGDSSTLIILYKHARHKLQSYVQFILQVGYYDMNSNSFHCT